MRTLSLDHLEARARYAKGQQRVEKILAAAQAVLIEEGYEALSMRRIASEAGLTVGNVSYYFKSKQELIHDLIDAVLESYSRELASFRDQADVEPEDAFRSAANFLLEDLGTRETTRFFPELWVLANHDDHAAACVEKMYDSERRILADIIARVNPKLAPEHALRLALIFAASVEGLTMFIGHEKSWSREAEAVIASTIDGTLAIIRNAA